jgi:hypothetical protein
MGLITVASVEARDPATVTSCCSSDLHQNYASAPELMSPAATKYYTTTMPPTSGLTRFQRDGHDTGIAS